jgi:hypothetical protein
MSFLVERISGERALAVAGLGSYRHGLGWLYGLGA